MSRQDYANTLVYNDISNLIKAAGEAEVFVYKAGTETLATLYEQRSGGSPKVNPFIVGSTAFANFWADSGDYDIKVHDTIVPARFGDYKFGWQSSPVVTEIGPNGLSNLGDIEWSQEGGGAWVPQLKANSVTANEIAANAVTNSKIITDAVDARAIAANSVLSSEIGVLPQCKVRKITDTAIAEAVETYLTFPTELEDTDTMHSTVSNTGRITCVTPGLYLFYSQIQFKEPSNVIGAMTWFRKTIKAGGTERFGTEKTSFGGGPATNGVITTSRPIRMVAEDYIEIGVEILSAAGTLIGEHATFGFGQEFGCIWQSS